MRPNTLLHRRLIRGHAAAARGQLTRSFASEPDPRISSEGAREIQDEFAQIRATYQTPKNAVVLAHGLLGFSELPLLGSLIPPIHYWRGIREALSANHVRVITATVPPSSSIEARAAKLHEQIAAQAPGESVNIVAHSMGGLDARYLISRLRPTEYAVKSLTTIATPHRGSAFADHVFDSLPPDLTPRLFRLCAKLGIETGAFEQLTRKYMTERFNPNVPDRAGVKYYSYGASCRPPLWSTFWASGRVIGRVEGENDGLVSVGSSMWGGANSDGGAADGKEGRAGETGVGRAGEGYKGTLVGVSHLDLINWTNRLRWLVWQWLGNKRTFNAVAFYLDITDMLAKEGL